MWTVLGLFWRRVWDNLFHVVAFNIIWFTLAIPFFYSVRSAVITLFPTQESSVAGAAESGGFEGTSALPPDRNPLSSTDTRVGGSSEAALLPGQAEKPRHTFTFGSAGAVSLVMLVMSWAVLCTATGFVYYGLADIVTEYDFSGYRFLLRRFLKKGPILKSIAVLTFFVLTFCASSANMFFYLALAQTKGLTFLLLGGIMLWFIVFLTMTCALVLPVMAQRDLSAAYAAEGAQAPDGLSQADNAAMQDSRLWPAFKTAALISLSSPLQTFFVLVLGILIMALGVFTMAGVGFFAVAAPAALFNAYAYVKSGGTVRWSPAQDEHPLYGSAN